MNREKWIQKINAYARKMIKACSKWIPDPLYLKMYAYLKRRRPVNLEHPVTYNDKLNWLKIHDRRPVITVCSDKLLVRDYVRQKLNEDILIPLLWSGSKPEDIPFDDLPQAYVIKTTHASGTNIIVKNKEQLQREHAITQLREWLNMNYFYSKREWGYKHIRPQIIIETFIGTEGKVPEDYKYFVFNGKVKLILIDHDREGNHTRSLYDQHWNRLPYTLKKPMYQGTWGKPIQLNRMIRYAETLGREFAHVRVDLYLVNERIYFGEMTFYNGGGFSRFIPEDDHWNAYYGNMLNVNEKQ